MTKMNVKRRAAAQPKSCVMVKARRLVRMTTSWTSATAKVNQVNHQTSAMRPARKMSWRHSTTASNKSFWRLEARARLFPSRTSMTNPSSSMDSVAPSQKTCVKLLQLKLSMECNRLRLKLTKSSSMPGATRSTRNTCPRTASEDWLQTTLTLRSFPKSASKELGIT